MAGYGLLHRRSSHVTALAGLLCLGCDRLPDSYTAQVRVSPPGEAEGAPGEVRVAFKRDVMRVDLTEGGAMPGFALAWRTRPEVFVMMPGREYAYRWNVRNVVARYDTPRLDEVLVLPFTQSPWLKGARRLGGGQVVDRQPCALWAKINGSHIHRIWVHEKWAIPMRYDTMDLEGKLLARYELHGLKPFASLDDGLFKVPAGVLAPAIPPAVP